MKKLRILLVSHGRPLTNFGGVGLVVDGLVRRFRELGHEVWLLSPRSGIRPKVQVQHQHIDWCHPRWSWKQGWKPTGSQQLHSVLSRQSFDVVHAHHLSGLPLQLWDGLRGAVRVLTLHDYALPCALGQMVTRDGSLCHSPSQGCANCITPWTPRQSSKQRLAMLGERSELVNKLLDETSLCLSPSQDLINRFSRFSNAEIEHFPLPLLRPLPMPAPEQRGLIFIGSIIPTKGLHVLLRAMALLPNPVPLTIVGGGAELPNWQGYQEQCRSMADQLGCRWLGHLGHEAALLELSRHKVLVLPSTWPENSPLVVREATALGLRTIVSTIGGAGELDEGAQLLPPNDHHSLARMITIALNAAPPKPRQWPSLSDHCDKLLNRYRLLL